MIGHISGNVIHHDLTYVIVDVGGLGYKVFTTTGTLSETRETISLWTHLIVREQVLDLYGFASREELAFFELLITVSGVGPKSALAILSIARVKDLKRAIASGETSHLTSVSGIGKKVAHKIVLELKDKILDMPSDDGGALSSEVEALEALKSLGYREADAREALRAVENPDLGTNERITQALKQLGSK